MGAMNAATEAGAGLNYVEAYASAAEWFADQLTRTNTRASVPACPGWTVLDLATHVGNVHAWAATVVETGRATPLLDDRPASNRPKRVAQWYLAKAEDLYSVLRDTPEDRACWNFAFGAGTALFWFRRQTHETLLHGLDLAVAADVPERFPTSLAADGVDEALTVFLHRMHQRGHPADLTAPVMVRAADADRCWVVEPAPRSSIPSQASGSRFGDRSAPRVTEGSRPDVDVVEGPAVAMLKLLWKRTDLAHAPVTLSGDQARLRRFLGSRLTP
jgi:uncharacterized protein (TIGR03083 family)